MANEAQGTVYLTANKNGGNVTQNKTFSLTMSGNELVRSTQLITAASWQALTWGAITGAPGAFTLTNLDATNYVDIAVANDDSGVFARLLPGPLAGIPGNSILITPKPGVTYYANAHTGSVRVEKAAAEA